MSVISTQPHHGSYHGRFTTNGGGGTENAFVYKIVGGNDVYARGYFYIDDGLPLVDDGDKFHLFRFRALGKLLTRAGIIRQGGVDRWTLFAKDGTSPVNVYSSSPAVEEGRWYCVELHWRRHSSQGLAELYLDGVKVLDITGIDTDAYGDVYNVQFGVVQGRNLQNSVRVYGDCVAVSDTYIGQEA
ncbi:MAG: hypothetical protein NWE79_05805 [Candidatus Bathyarchaeota archaeon]|nr:hypothetical protein [Candidatus Bathyarchaeota archaeon]